MKLYYKCYRKSTNNEDRVCEFLLLKVVSIFCAECNSYFEKRYKFVKFLKNLVHFLVFNNTKYEYIEMKKTCHKFSLVFYEIHTYFDLMFNLHNISQFA